MAVAYAVGWWLFERTLAACRVGIHDWRVTNYPAVMYPGIADWAGTRECKRCRRFGFFFS